MTASSSDPLGVLQILWEALQLPAKAGAFFLPLLLLHLLSYSFLSLSAYCIAPLVLDVVAKLSPLFKSPLPLLPSLPSLFRDIESDLRIIARVASLAALVFFFASLFLLVATFYTFTTTYVGQSISLKQLLLRISRRWYKTLVTRLYVLLLTLGLALLSALAIAALTLSSDPPNLSPRYGGPFFIFLIFLYLYLSTRWRMSLAIAVAEETWGIGALSMSVVLFIDNKKRGTLLTLVLKAVQIAIFGAFAAAMAAASAGPPPPPEDQLKMWAGVAAASAVWELYAMAVYTVFYYECRKSHGLEQVKSGDAWGFIYTSLPSAAAVV
ncbi:uncharacterized protein LOC141830855 [Curcuma longa]|uniref:uncharacterized protein LOC141830855 n=1 Tax=Curcuma longa TaxID=136217 RepID=UPI003D9ECD6F